MQYGFTCSIYIIYTVESLHVPVWLFFRFWDYGTKLFFRNVLPFSLVDVYRNFRGAFWLHRQVAVSSGTSMNIYQTTRHLRSQKQAMFLFIYVISERRRSWRVCQRRSSVYVLLWLLALLVTVDAYIVSYYRLHYRT